MTSKFLIGADPELFVSENGKLLSAHGLVEGTKWCPHKVDRGAVQVDGIALEFNIDPASNKEEFFGNLQAVQQQLKEMIGDRDFIQDCSVFFDEEFTKTTPLESLELGCNPDFNAYYLEPNEKPDGNMMMRTAGGHIHIGIGQVKDEWEMSHIKLSANLAKAMDKFVGVYSILWDKDDNRRSLYGKAGAFRPKTYGMEYRTLSNAWIFNKTLVDFIYEQTAKAVDFVLSGNKVVGDTYQKIIDTSDRNHEFFKGDATAAMLKERLNG